MHVDVKLVKKIRLVPLAELHATRGLEDMVTLRKGNRLSITPVTPGRVEDRREAGGKRPAGGR